MTILYIGSSEPFSNAWCRAEALRREGHTVLHFEPKVALPPGKWQRMLHYRTGYRLVARTVLAKLKAFIGGSDFEMAWVDSGELISAECVRFLKNRCKKVVNYNSDDPTGGRDSGRWGTFLRAIKEYDLLVVNRPESEVEYRAYGAKRVLRAFRTYDPVLHQPVEMTAEERALWSSEVAFVGTWMPERGPFMQRLLELGIPLSIYGNRWEKAPEHRRLKAAIKGPAVTGRNYVLAIQGAKISLGLLSKGNRDRHTRRSAEVPFIGSLFCAERTDEHLALFNENLEAVFWADADECAARIKALLGDSALRDKIAANGRERVIANRLDNDSFVHNVMESLFHNS